MLDEYLLTKNQTIAVALSGGKDSVCLLHLLLSAKDRLSITVKAINVEHGIRGESSVKDSEFCKKLCEAYGVPIECYSVNAPVFAKENGLSEETAARILRYDCFNNALIAGFCDKIATAHHQSDNFETLLFNVFRGASLKGACGISKTANDGKIIRPLLSVSREDIEKYVEENKLPYVTDESNYCCDYSRNYIRNVIIPAINERFPSAEKNAMRFASLLREEDDFLDSLAEKLIRRNEVALSDDDVLFRRACLKVMKNEGFTADYGAVHLQSLVRLKNLQCGSTICLKDGLSAYRTHNSVIFEKSDKPETDYEIPFALGDFYLGDYLLKIERSERKNDGYLYFDLDKVPYNTVIRTKRQGDVITAFGGNTKKLKKYLCDKKIESRRSADFPLLAWQSEIIAVCPIDISERIKIDEKTVNTARIVCTKQGDDLNA